MRICDTTPAHGAFGPATTLVASASFFPQASCSLKPFRLLPGLFCVLLAACGGGGGGDTAVAVSAGGANPDVPTVACQVSVKSGYAPVTASNGLSYGDGAGDGSAGSGSGAGAGDGSASSGSGDGGGAGAGGDMGALVGAVITVVQADGTVLGSALTDAFSMVSIKACGSTQPLLITAQGAANATYWDEATQSQAPFPATEFLHVMVAPVGAGKTLSKNVGITPLTEAAYQYAIAKLGGVDAWKSAANVATANAAVAAEFNRFLPSTQSIDDITRLPVIARDASSKVFASSASKNDNYGLVMAGLARSSNVRNTAAIAPAVDLKRQLAFDLSDGRLDALGPNNVPVAPTGTQRSYVLPSFTADVLAGMQSVAATNGTTQLQFSTFTLGGSVSGLTDAGLVLANGGGTLGVPANASSFSFGAVLVTGGTYNLTVKTQPLAHICTVVNGSGTTGTASVSTPAVTCTRSTTPHTLSGSITGLSAAGLVLANGSASVSVAAGATAFTFGSVLVSGSTYGVVVQTQPAGFNCTVSNGNGTAGSVDITTPAVSCASNPVITFTLAGTVAGLTVNGLVLANGNATVAVAANATTFSFGSVLVAGAAYNVTVQTQPSGQTCTVATGTGTTGSANVSSPVVTCAFPLSAWTWVNGSNTPGAVGVYGTKGTAAASNTPGARASSSSWTDSSGNFWLFGGYQAGPQSTDSVFSDLWRYSPSSGNWTWISGPNAVNTVGVYGTKGTAASGNVPGARNGATSWSDSSGNLWLFGGNGYAAAGGPGGLNDLWRYSPGTGLWTWVSGSNVVNAVGSYGTKGTATSGTVPGARRNATAWTDSSGHLWLFGGTAYDSVSPGQLSDLWRFTPSSGSNSGVWTWISGSNLTNSTGTYGSKGTASSGNLPGARERAVAWTDVSGRLWLFGGFGFGSTNVGFGGLNDLWRYDPATGAWTWINGADTIDPIANYGTKGTAAAANVPAGRTGSTTWTDATGSLWLFGGYFPAGGAFLNDLWRYSTSTGNWTWVGGAAAVNTFGDYGTKGVSAASNSPGARRGAPSWVGPAGTLWLFGGISRDAGGLNDTFFNDLWKFQP